MTNDPVLALIEKWEADARRQDWPANGEFLTPQECAKQIRAILPQRDQAVAETVERCCDWLNQVAEISNGYGKSVLQKIVDGLRNDISGADPLYRQRIENAARLEELQELVAGSTHWEGCEKSHPICRRIAQLEAERDELAKGAGK